MVITTKNTTIFILKENIEFFLDYILLIITFATTFTES